MTRTHVDTIDWTAAEDALNEVGSAVLPGLLTHDECDALTALYPRDTLYRSRVVMARHGFGRGEYKYFAYPLPDRIAQLRTALYPLEPSDEHRRALPRCACRFPAPLPRGRPVAPDTVDPAVRPR
jgi:hypothetical protein